MSYLQLESTIKACIHTKLHDQCVAIFSDFEQRIDSDSIKTMMSQLTTLLEVDSRFEE
jgi:hypothetical protein